MLFFVMLLPSFHHSTYLIFFSYFPFVQASSLYEGEDPRMLRDNLETPGRRRISRSLIIGKSNSLSVNTELDSYGREKEKLYISPFLLSLSSSFFHHIFLFPPYPFLPLLHPLSHPSKGSILERVKYLKRVRGEP